MGPALLCTYFSTEDFVTWTRLTLNLYYTELAFQIVVGKMSSEGAGPAMNALVAGTLLSILCVPKRDLFIFTYCLVSILCKLANTS